MIRQTLKHAAREARIRIRKLVRSAGYDIVRAQPDAAAALALGPLVPRTVIDVGANRGQFARLARAWFPEAQIHSFEPLPEPFAELRAWAAKQNGKVSCYNTALGAASGEIEFRLHLDSSASSSALQTTTECGRLYAQTREQTTIRVPITTLDDALADMPLPVPILLKVDVQGYEDRVIAGAQRLLGRVDACLLEVGIESLYVGQATFATLVTEMGRHALHFAGCPDQVRGPDGRIVFVDALFARNQGSNS